MHTCTRAHTHTHTLSHHTHTLFHNTHSFTSTSFDLTELLIYVKCPVLTFANEAGEKPYSHTLIPGLNYLLETWQHLLMHHNVRASRSKRTHILTIPVCLRLGFTRLTSGSGQIQLTAIYSQTHAVHVLYMILLTGNLFLLLSPLCLLYGWFRPWAL